MNKLPLSIKIFVAYTTLILVFLVTILVSTFNLFEASQKEQIWVELESKSHLISELAKDHLNKENFDSIIKSLRIDERTRITIIASNGIVLADSKKNPKTMDNHLDRPELQEASKLGRGKSVRYSVTVKSNMLYFAIPIVLEDKIVAYTRTSLWKTNVDDLSSTFLDSLIFSALWIILAALVLALFLSKSILRPMEKLVAFASRLPKENFKTRSDLKRKDELGDLSDSLNYMADEIQTLFTKLDTEKKEFELIVNSLQDPLLVVESDLKIRFANQSFTKNFAYAHSEDSPEHIYNVILANNLISEIENAFKKSRALIGNFEYEGRHYYVSFTHIAAKKNVVCIFYDITDEKLLEAQKRDFVSNVSHELRTPLTSIKGFVETILDDEIDDDKRHYLDIIHRNTNRLIHMISDLLSLSSLENQVSPLNLEESDLRHIIDQVAVIFKDNFTEKGISFEIKGNEKEILLKLDEYRIEQVFINLIENAIKYSEAAKIELTCTNFEDRVEIDIADNGIGISEENLQRIFERFYVVDQSRSRKMGGTGLGLSLVKHIVQLHKGKISATSILGKGTEFKIVLKK